jgi:hypothetical protein
MKIILLSFAFFIIITKITTLRIDVHQVNDSIENSESNLNVNNNLIDNNGSNNVNNDSNLFIGNFILNIL